MKKLPTMAHNSDNDELELFSPPDRLLEVDYDEGEIKKKKFHNCFKKQLFSSTSWGEWAHSVHSSKWMKRIIQRLRGM